MISQRRNMPNFVKKKFSPFFNATVQYTFIGGVILVRVFLVFIACIGVNHGVPGLGVGNFNLSLNTNV